MVASMIRATWASGALFSPAEAWEGISRENASLGRTTGAGTVGKYLHFHAIGAADEVSVEDFGWTSHRLHLPSPMRDQPGRRIEPRG